MPKALRERRARQQAQRKAHNECGRKFGFKTKEEAVIGALTLPDRQPDKVLRAYQCNYCNRWHLGHSQEA